MAGACARHAVAIPFAPALPLDNGAVGYKRVLFNVGASELHGYGSGTPARGTEHLVRSMRWTEMAFFFHIQRDSTAGTSTAHLAQAALFRLISSHTAQTKGKL